MSRLVDVLNKAELFIYMWQYNMQGGFMTSLIDTIMRADNQNLAKLRLGFPFEVGACERYMKEENFWPNIEMKIKQYYESLEKPIPNH